MHYFAYGSNMSLARLRARVPSAKAMGRHRLIEHDLRFHKAGKDGSGKCDAYFTANVSDIIYGALFLIDPKEKVALDEAEGLGYGYDQKTVTVIANSGGPIEAFTYIATHIDEMLKPFSWYMNHVIIGARETELPERYIDLKIGSVEFVEDKNRDRDAEQRAIHL